MKSKHFLNKSRCYRIAFCWWKPYTNTRLWSSHVLVGLSCNVNTYHEVSNQNSACPGSVFSAVCSVYCAQGESAEKYVAKGDHTHTFRCTIHTTQCAHWYIRSPSNFQHCMHSCCSSWGMSLTELGLSYLKMPSVWAPPRARTYWESWTCTQGSFLSGKSSLCRSITSSRELPKREGVTIARLLWSISSKVGLRRPWRVRRKHRGRIYNLGISGAVILMMVVSAAVLQWLGLCLCLYLWL